VERGRKKKEQTRIGSKYSFHQGNRAWGRGRQREGEANTRVDKKKKMQIETKDISQKKKKGERKGGGRANWKRNTAY